MAIDVETTGILREAGHKLHGFAITTDTGATQYFTAQNIPAAVHKLLSDTTILRIAHRATFDKGWMGEVGASKGTWVCTKLLAHVVNETKLTGLKFLTKERYGESELDKKNELDKVVQRVCASDKKKKAKKKYHVGNLCHADLKTKGRPYTGIIGEYCCEDTRNTARLYRDLSKEIKALDTRVKNKTGQAKGPRDYYLEEIMPTEPYLERLMNKGLRVDVARLKIVAAQMMDERSRIISSLRGMAPEIREIENEKVERVRATKKQQATKDRVKPGSKKQGTQFSWTSPKDFPRMLEMLDVPYEVNPGTGRAKLAKEQLNALIESDISARAKQIVSGVKEIRQLTDNCSTFIGNRSKGVLQYEYNGRIYPRFHQFTDTGRLGTAEPNVQNFPQSAWGQLIRECYRPANGNVFVYADYSAVELYIAAHLSKDAKLIADCRSADPHIATARRMFPHAKLDKKSFERQVCKEVNYLTIFGGGAGGLRRSLMKRGAGDFPAKQCAEWIEGWFAQYKRYQKHLAEILQFGIRNGFYYAANGRIRNLPELRAGQGCKLYRGWGRYDDIERKHGEAAVKAFIHAEHQIYNFPVQSLGATIWKRALRGCMDAGLDVVFGAHDSLVIECRAEERKERAVQLREIMEGVYDLAVPLKVEVKILRSLSEQEAYE